MALVNVLFFACFPSANNKRVHANIEFDYFLLLKHLAPMFRISFGKVTNRHTLNFHAYRILIKLIVIFALENSFTFKRRTSVASWT